MYHTYQAYGNLVTKSVQESLTPLLGIAFDLSARVGAYYNANNGQDCAYYFTVAIPDDADKVNSICANYDFSDVNDISYF
jgi:hypothetical protein